MALTAGLCKLVSMEGQEPECVQLNQQAYWVDNSCSALSSTTHKDLENKVYQKLSPKKLKIILHLNVYIAHQWHIL